MKKTIIICIALVLGLQLKAQDAFNPSGKISIDLNFNPAAIFDANAGSMFTMPFIKGRYFITSKTALRLGFLTVLDSETEYQDLDGNDFIKNKSTLFTIAPGFEKQFGSNRFYFYLGGELPISTFTTKEITDIGGNSVVSKNQDGGYLSVGLNLVLGCDFYIFPNFYMGAEFNPGFVLTNFYDQKFDDDVVNKGGYATNFGLSSSSGIRLGVRF